MGQTVLAVQPLAVQPRAVRAVHQPLAVPVHARVAVPSAGRKGVRSTLTEATAGTPNNNGSQRTQNK